MMVLIRDARLQGLALAGAVLLLANGLIADADRAVAKNRQEKWGVCAAPEARRASLEWLLFHFSGPDLPIRLDEIAARGAGNAVQVLVVLDKAAPDSFVTHYSFIRAYTESRAACMASSRRPAST